MGKLTDEGRECLDVIKNGGMIWPVFGCKMAGFIGVNHRGRHYAGPQSTVVGLFEDKLIDRHGRITPAGRLALKDHPNG